MRSARCTIGLSACLVLSLAALSSHAQELQARTPGLASSVNPLRSAPASRIVTLEPEEEPAPSLALNTSAAAKLPANFRQLGSARIGQVLDPRALTLRFSAATTLSKIQSTPDFKVEQGGTCVEGYSYLPNQTCTLLVRFTPQGAGHRLGKLTITDTADATPLYVGITGEGYSPTISFTPSIITTVPGTYVSGAGTISGASNLAIDGGDNLYIADTGHNEIKSIDSSGTIVNASAFGLTAPLALTVDTSGDIYFTESGQSHLSVLPSPYLLDNYGDGSNSACAIGSTCPLFNANLDFSATGALALDPNGTVFANLDYLEAIRISNSTSGLEYTPLFTPVNYDNVTQAAPRPLAVDSSDTLYTYYASGGAQCIITGESYYNAAVIMDNPVMVAGNNNACGFSGDGGQARGAEISTEVGQMAFDIAGNLYFTDTLNQRVRRIDGATGIITTIAGNGAIGYSGDNGPATSATLHTPTGLTVDSQGQVYILSNSASTGTAQVVRKVGTVGALALGTLAIGSASAAQTVTLANTGNSELDFTHVGFSSGNTSDFAIDPNTTSCNFTVALAQGRSCKIGFIFTPSAVGSRSAVLSITDDTVTGLNTIQFSGTGATTATLTPASFTYASTAVGSSAAAQTATLTNTGKGVLTISSIAFSGTNATSFTDTTTCGTTLAVGATCTIAVTFKPTTTGTLTATLTVADNAIGSHQTITLTGAGVSAAAKPVLSPTGLAFASQTVATASAAKTVTLTNSGGSSLTITSFTIAGTNAADFTQTHTCGTTLAAAASCTISVVFKPAAAGSRSASLAVATSAGAVTETLSGTATAAAAAAALALASAANPSWSSQALAITAWPTGAWAATPTGNVQLIEDGKLLTQGAMTGNGVVTFSALHLGPGVHTLQAVYLGDAKNPAVSSATVRQVVRFAAILPMPPVGTPVKWSDR